MSAKVAFLGLGVMGFPMAGHLKSKGYDVVVYNRTAAKSDAWVQKHGGKSAPTPAASVGVAAVRLAAVSRRNSMRTLRATRPSLRPPPTTPVCRR